MNFEPSNIKWTSYFRAQCGYSESARYFIKGLFSKNFPVKINSIPFEKEFDLPVDMERILSGYEKVALEQNYIDIQHIFPEVMEFNEDSSYKIGRIFFEVDGIPSRWIEKIKKIDEIWVASRHIKHAFLNSGIGENRLKIIPECIDTDLYNPDSVLPIIIPERKKFVFLSIFDWRLQKGWDVLIESFATAFTSDDDACLVLKVHSSAGFPAEEIREQVNGYMLKKMHLNEKVIPKIIFIEENLSTSDMVRLIAASDAFVLPSRAEGWGRPYMEAMLMQKPVIGTNWGGNLDFMNNKNSFLIGCELEKVSAEGIIEIPNYRGFNWANPSKKSLADIMSYIYKNYGKALEKAKIGQSDVRKKYNLETVSEKVIGRLNEIKKIINKPKEVILEGKFISGGSLSSINRDIFKEIHKDYKNFSIKIVSDENFKGLKKYSGQKNNLIELDQNLIKLFTKNLILNYKNIKTDFYIKHEWPPNFTPPDDGYFIMMQPWEYGCLPKDWIYPFNNIVDGIWVYSNFLKESYIKSGVDPDKISVIAPFINSKMFCKTIETNHLKTARKFKFLFVGGTIGRKGTDILLNAYLNEFKKDEDVCLVIKDVGVNTFYRNANIKENIVNLANNLDNAEILYIDNEFKSETEMVSLYNSCSCYVHPYRAEGFGLPIAEAMSCEIPVITTGYGACLDFCNDMNSYLLKYEILYGKEKEIDGINVVDYPYWAEPDISDLKSKMRHVFENYNEALQKAKIGRSDIIRNLNTENNLNSIKASLKKIGSKEITRFGQENQKDNINYFNIENNFNNAIRLIDNSDLNGGEDLLKKILEFEPGHRDSIKTLSRLYLKTNKSELAIKLVSNYLKNNDDDSEFMNLMGVYLNSIGEIKLARLFYKKSSHLSKDSDIILKNLEMTENIQGKSQNKKISSKFLYLLELAEKNKILKPSIALCMIVKNEERNLSRCLNSIKDIVNEIIIVDTGSTDKTKEIARNFGAEVKNFEWVDDFSKARNESIKDIKSDWILYLDADEYLDNSGKNFFENLGNSDKPLAFYAKIISFMNKANNNVTSESVSLRLFNNKKGFKFKGNIHEQLILNDGEEYERILSSIILRHTGYLEDEMSEKNKNNRNYGLLIKALENDPENAFNYYNLGVNLFTNQEYYESIKYFGLAIDKLNSKIATFTPFCYSYSSSAYCGLGKYAEAIKFAEKAIESAPYLKDAYYCLANAQFFLNDHENALTNFKKTLEIKDEVVLGGTTDKGASNWKSLNGIGATYLKIEDYENALEYLWEAYKIENKSAMVILNLLVAHKKTGNLEAFLKVLDDIKDVEFSVGQTQQMVNIFLLSKKFDKSFRVLKNVLDFYTGKNIKKDREGIEISILKENMADIYFAKNDYKNAVINYEDYFKITEGTYASYKNSGVCYFHLSDYSKAEYCFDKAARYDLKSLNNDWEIYHNTGIVKMKLEKLDEALAYFKKSISLNPNDLEAYNNLGKIYLVNKDYENANVAFESHPGFISDDPDPDILFYNSEALYFLEKYDDALKNLFIYLEKVKEDEEAYNKAGLCFHKLREYNEAANYFLKAIDINNKNPNYFYNLGNCLFDADNIEDARLAYNCALMLDNNHVPSIACLQIVDISEKTKI